MSQRGKGNLDSWLWARTVTERRRTRDIGMESSVEWDRTVDAVEDSLAYSPFKSGKEAVELWSTS